MVHMHFPDKLVSVVNIAMECTCWQMMECRHGCLFMHLALSGRSAVALWCLCPCQVVCKRLGRGVAHFYNFCVVSNKISCCGRKTVIVLASSAVKSRRYRNSLLHMMCLWLIVGWRFGSRRSATSPGSMGVLQMSIGCHTPYCCNDINRW